MRTDSDRIFQTFSASEMGAEAVVENSGAYVGKKLVEAVQALVTLPNQTLPSNTLRGNSRRGQVQEIRRMRLKTLKLVFNEILETRIVGDDQERARLQRLRAFVRGGQNIGALFATPVAAESVIALNSALEGGAFKSANSRQSGIILLDPKLSNEELVLDLVHALAMTRSLLGGVEPDCPAMMADAVAQAALFAAEMRIEGEKLDMPELTGFWSAFEEIHPVAAKAFDDTMVMVAEGEIAPEPGQDNPEFGRELAACMAFRADMMVHNDQIDPQEIELLTAQASGYLKEMGTAQSLPLTASTSKAQLRWMLPNMINAARLELARTFDRSVSAPNAHHALHGANGKPVQKAGEGKGKGGKGKWGGGAGGKGGRGRANRMSLKDRLSKMKSEGRKDKLAGTSLRPGS